MPQWSVNDAGVATGQCTIKADAGTYTHAILCSAGGTTDSMIDNCPIGTPDGVTLNGAGQVVLDVTYTQS
jgi:hypothetical protein